MAVGQDRWIRARRWTQKMIEPFTTGQGEKEVIVMECLYGDDIRVADEFRIFHYT